MKTRQPRLLLPPHIYGIPGREMNIYFNNILLSPVHNQYLFSVNCKKGKHLEKRWTWVPTPDEIGNESLSLEVRDWEDEIVATADVVISVSPLDAGKGHSITHLAIGDSITHPAIYTDELMRLFSLSDNPSYRLVGTHHVPGTVPGNVHEGYGGWKYIDFVERAEAIQDSHERKFQKSPFVFQTQKEPRLDFSRYVRENLDGHPPDIITTFLGPNDVSLAVDANLEEFVDRTISASQRLVKNLRRGAPKAKIGIVSPMPTSMDQDIFGESYGCLISSWQFRKNLHRLTEKLFAEYHNHRDDGVSFIPAYINFDTANNFPKIAASIHSRSNTVISRGSNAHPTKDGYRQIAESLYAWIKGQPFT